MHPQTKRLFYPDERIDPEYLGIGKGTRPMLVKEKKVEDMLVDFMLDRLDAEDLYDYCYQIDKENHEYLKEMEGRRGFNEDERVTAYDHEQTLQTKADEWVAANVKYIEICPYTEYRDEGELFNYLTNKVYDEVKEYEDWDL